MKILCVFGEHNYGDPSRGRGYEYTNFLPAFRRLGHQVVFFESFNRAAYSGFAEMNRAFLQTVAAEKPDVIFFVLMGYEIWLETLQMVRETCNSILIHWSTDDSWKYGQFSRFIAPVFDIYATTSAAAFEKSRKDGFSNFVLTQWAANAETLAEPLPASQCRHRVSFIGSAYGNRGRRVAQLRERGIEVSCFGHGWPHGPVAAEEIPRLIRESVISLNFGDSGVVVKGVVPGRSRQIKARVFEVPGAGGFLLTEGAEEIEKYYLPGQEIAVFSSLDDLASQIAYFLAHPAERDRIACAGHARTRAEHTYDMRFRQLLDAAKKRAFPAAGKGCEYDAAAFALLEKAHKPGMLLQLLKYCLLPPCTLVWGKEKGARAARRLLFELSWRVAGKKTYSVSGWPGRLFYRES